MRCGTAIDIGLLRNVDDHPAVDEPLFEEHSWSSSTSATRRAGGVAAPEATADVPLLIHDRGQRRWRTTRSGALWRLA
jgi:hypothetical protein